MLNFLNCLGKSQKFNCLFLMIFFSLTIHNFLTTLLLWNLLHLQLHILYISFGVYFITFFVSIYQFVFKTKFFYISSFFSWIFVPFILQSPAYDQGYSLKHALLESQPCPIDSNLNIFFSVLPIKIIKCLIFCVVIGNVCISHLPDRKDTCRIYFKQE